MKINEANWVLFALKTSSLSSSKKDHYEWKKEKKKINEKKKRKDKQGKNGSFALIGYKLKAALNRMDENLKRTLSSYFVSKRSDVIRNPSSH